MTPAPRWHWTPTDALGDALADDPDARLARRVDRWQAQMRAWWHTERPPMGRHHPDFPTRKPAHEEAA